MSGRITIDNLSDSLKEMIANSGMTEEQIIELLENEEVIDSLKTDSKSIVGAINELFQSANNGKELIASAIGEPLDSNDTFSAMSDDINSLLSTFKTNMMNSGVMVESSDKFKQLIEKIKGITEGEGNKGVQYTEISLNENFSSASGTTSKTFTFEDIGFLPSIYFLHITNIDEDVVNICVPNGFTTDCLSQVVIVRLTDITTSSLTVQFTIDSYYTDYIFTLSGLKLIAIGIGEEDTTLRDSLASILTEEGVSVTEEDDMASLITKVDEEFDRKIDVKSGSYISPITMTEDIRKITITHNLGKAPSFISIYIPYTSLYYLYGGYENYLQASTTRAMNYIIDSRVYYDADHCFIVLADSNRYMHAYITDITDTSFSFAMCCGMEGSGYEIHLDSFDWIVM